MFLKFYHQIRNLIEILPIEARRDRFEAIIQTACLKLIMHEPKEIERAVKRRNISDRVHELVLLVIVGMQSIRFLLIQIVGHQLRVNLGCRDLIFKWDQHSAYDYGDRLIGTSKSSEHIHDCVSLSASFLIFLN